MPVKEYREEFYNLSIRSRQNEESLKSIAKYVNGLSHASLCECVFVGDVVDDVK